jgi:hypothetical protein
MKNFNKYMENIAQKSRWNEIIHRPKLPEGWSCIEQQSSRKAATTSFVRWGKLHHNGEPERIWVVFVEHNPEYFSTPYVVRGGLHAKGPSGLNYFQDLKTATECLVSIMEATDRWIEEINSEKYIKAYNDKIAAAIRAEEKRRKDSAELYA